MGYSVFRNNPYAGGFITDHYGCPGEGVHALQIEINRALYMDGSRITRTRGFARGKRHMTKLVRALSEIETTTLLPQR